MLAWSERNSVDYIVGLAKNKRLEAITGHLMTGAQDKHEMTGAKVRDFGWINYAAGSWDRERLVIAKAEHSFKGSNPRYGR